MKTSTAAPDSLNDMPANPRQGRVTADELERLLEAHPRFRRAAPEPADQISITFVSTPAPRGTALAVSRLCRRCGRSACPCRQTR